MPNLIKAASRFHAWMRSSGDTLRATGIHADNEDLVKYLNWDQGFWFVKTYEEFCELADLVKALGYDTTNPPCTPFVFAEAIENADAISFGEIMPTMPKEMIAHFAVARFDEWIKRLEEYPPARKSLGDDNRALVKFLTFNRGFRYIKTYEELCKFADLVKAKGYATTNPPCTPFVFAEAADDPRLESFDKILPVIPKELVAYFAVKHFNTWSARTEEHLYRTVEKIDDNKKILVKYIAMGGGFRYLKTYEEFCEFADLLRAEGYLITNPPCSSEEYNLAVIYNLVFHQYVTMGGGSRYIKTYKDLCEFADLLRAQGCPIANPPCSYERYNFVIELYFGTDSDDDLPPRKTPRHADFAAGPYVGRDFSKDDLPPGVPPKFADLCYKILTGAMTDRTSIKQAEISP